jgi:hypothetical protein
MPFFLSLIITNRIATVRYGVNIHTAKVAKVWEPRGGCVTMREGKVREAMHSGTPSSPTHPWKSTVELFEIFFWFIVVLLELLDNIRTHVGVPFFVFNNGVSETWQ